MSKYLENKKLNVLDIGYTLCCIPSSLFFCNTHAISLRVISGLFSNRLCLPSPDFTGFLKKLSKSAVAYLFHRILSLQLLGSSLRTSHLSFDQFKVFLCLFIQICQIAVLLCFMAMAPVLHIVYFQKTKSLCRCCLPGCQTVFGFQRSFHLLRRHFSLSDRYKRSGQNPHHIS